MKIITLAVCSVLLIGCQSTAPVKPQIKYGASGDRILPTAYVPTNIPNIGISRSMELYDDNGNKITEYIPVAVQPFVAPIPIIGQCRKVVAYTEAGQRQDAWLPVYTNAVPGQRK